MRLLLYVLFSVLMLFPVDSYAKKREVRRAKVLSSNYGYYKDLFMDSGIALTSRHSLHAAHALSLSMEYFASASKNMTSTDTLLQKQIFCGSEDDTNGWLLYPDGAPRYRVIYVNGGGSARHARSLTSEGRSNIRRYVAEGGSYVGTCAGSALSSAGAMLADGRILYSDIYFNIWPGIVHRTNLKKIRTGMAMPRGCPLLKYYDFGGDRLVENVAHNRGNFALDDEEYPLPAGTLPLARYVYEGPAEVNIDGQISTWSYKPDEKTGRTVVIGSHPEIEPVGERRDFMCALLLHAMEGNAGPRPKADLQFGSLREMNRYWEDNDPAYTAIGDRQYHHFTVMVPKKCKSMTITLKGYEGKDDFDLTLCANPKKMAFLDNSLHVSEGKGCSRQLIIENPKQGVWYVSVFCDTTVETATGAYGTEYTGRRDVLNGVPYSIAVK